MALVASTMGKQAGQYLAAATVNALAKKIGQQVDQHLTLENIAGVVRGRSSRKPKRKQRVARQPAYNKQQVQILPTAISYPSSNGRMSATNYRVHNREFVASVQSAGTGGYQVSRIVTVQPGLVESFPWLSGIAQYHQKYCIKNLRYHYIPQVSVGVSGRVGMAFSPDVLDDVPPTVGQFYQYANEVDTQPWAAAELTVPSKMFETKYTRSKAVPNTDLKTYDSGVLFVIIDGNSNPGTNFGTVFAEYDVEFYSPQPSSVNLAQGISIVPLSAAGNAAWFDDGPTPIAGQPWQLYGASASTLPNGLQFLERGWFCVTINIAATTTTGGLAITAPRVEYGTVVNFTQTIQTGVRVFAQCWVNIFKLSESGILAQIKLNAATMAGISTIQVVIQKMDTDELRTIDFTDP
jgi:hypothetical protein